MDIIVLFFFFFFNDTATTEIYTLSLHDALPISNYFSQRIWLHKFYIATSPHVSTDDHYTMSPILFPLSISHSVNVALDILSFSASSKIFSLSGIIPVLTIRQFLDLSAAHGRLTSSPLITNWILTPQYGACKGHNMFYIPMMQTHICKSVLPPVFKPQFSRLYYTMAAAVVRPTQSGHVRM